MTLSMLVRVFGTCSGSAIPFTVVLFHFVVFHDHHSLLLFFYLFIHSGLISAGPLDALLFFLSFRRHLVLLSSGSLKTILKAFVLLLAPKADCGLQLTSGSLCSSAKTVANTSVDDRNGARLSCRPTHPEYSSLP